MDDYYENAHIEEVRIHISPDVPELQKPAYLIFRCGASLVGFFPYVNKSRA